MKSLVLPYGVRFIEDGRIEVFPGAEIVVKGQNGNDIYAVFHIDSGASTSIIPIDDGPNLGIDPIKGDRVLVRGVGDSTYFGYRHLLKLKLGDVSFGAPVIMVEHASVPRILGREGVFHRFGILFDEARHRTGLLDSKKQRKEIDSLFQ